MLQERTPKVSVVIPTYNSADFITCALDSIDAQEYPDVEIIVVDDGSTDDTKGIVERYGHNIRLVSQANAGPAVARNRGLREASGKYVAMLDADDWFLPTKFHKQVALLEDNTQLGAVHSGWMLADASGREFGTVEPWHVSPKLNVKTWLAYQPVRLGSLLFRREWLTKVGGFDKEMRQSEDTELLLRLAVEGCKFEWLKEPTLCYRHHSGSMVRSRVSEQAASMQMLLNKVFANPRLPSSVRHCESSVRYYSTTWIAWHLFQTGHGDATEDYLESAARHSSFTKSQMIQDWTAQFAFWHSTEGKDPDQVRAMWPKFRHATQATAAEWQRIENNLNWCLDVWTHYAQKNYEQGATKLQTSPYTRSSGRGLYSQLHFYVTFTPWLDGLEAVERLWSDATALGWVTNADQLCLARLYARLACRLLWCSNLKGASIAMMRAVKTGAMPRDWPAWKRTAERDSGNTRGRTRQQCNDELGHRTRKFVPQVVTTDPSVEADDATSQSLPRPRRNAA